MSENNKKVLLSLKNVDVKFNVRGRILSAIRNVSLDIYENESIAIVGESGSGKSVLTKTFAGMLDSNGMVSNGKIIFSDDEISNTDVHLDIINKNIRNISLKVLGKYSYLDIVSKQNVEIANIKQTIKESCYLSEKEKNDFDITEKDINDDINDLKNSIATLDTKVQSEYELYQTQKAKLTELLDSKKKLEVAKKEKIKETKSAFKNSSEYTKLLERIKQLKEEKKTIYKKAVKEKVLADNKDLYERNLKIANEIVLSIGRFPTHKKVIYNIKILKALKKAILLGKTLDDDVLNAAFETAAFRVVHRQTYPNGDLNGYAIIDCAKIKYTKDWQLIRGRRIATVFQDPMTSLNPIVTIGKQIMTVILKHQKCSYFEAKQKALEIMTKVGIPEAKKRFNDYPFQYSGGMRQRIVIAIALSCQPKILICDEPTTALDVTIQAQIIRLIKDLQKDLGFTTVYITHDLGVVANVAERVAVLYGGQIVEIGTVEEIFYDPKHPYTWALLSSLPQLSKKGEDLFSIPGTPPSLYNKIIGDAFAPRNRYAMAIDLQKEPPMFKVSETHYAKTWLLDPRAPKVEKPENIQNLHEKMCEAFKNID